MRRIELHYQITQGTERVARLRNPMMDLLFAVRTEGSISAAARRVGYSYRHVWGQLKAWEAELGQALIHVFALPPDPEGQVALTTLLRDALDQVVARLCDWHLQPLPAPQLAERQAALRTYLVRVLMGTQTLHHGSQRFADLFP